MNLGTAFSSFFSNLFAKAETTATDEIQHRDWSSIRWIALVGFVGLIIFNTTKQLVSSEGLTLIFKAFVVWTIGNTLTRLAVIAANAWRVVTLAKVFDQDGQLTTDERAFLDSTKPGTLSK